MTKKAFEAGVDESKLKIYQLVGLDGGEFKAEQEGKLTLTVDIMPKFHIPEYKGIITEVPSGEVSNDEVDVAIEAMRGQRASYNEVDRAAQKGDFVRVSYFGTVDGTAISELVPDRPIWGKQENTWEEAGAEETYGVKAVVDGIVQMSAGDRGGGDMEFPEEFEVPELAGKKAKYEFEVHEVRERVLPELNEELFKSLQVESLEMLKDRFYQSLEAEKRQRVVREKRRQITEELSARIEFPLPESAIESETDAAMEEIVRQNARRGVSEDEMDAHKEEIFANARRAAAARVKMSILLARIADEESIEVEEKDMQRYLAAEAMSTNARPEQLVKDLQNDPARLMSIRRTILANKTLDMLVEEASVKIVERAND